MDIIEELKYYCNELQPVGALMLTGEWGCGKTYLLNNILNNAIEDTHIILRVSLFGLESIEEVHKEVKKCWFYAFYESKESMSWMAEKAKKFGKNIKSVVDGAKEFLPESIKTIADGVLSLDAIDFIKIEPNMGNKKVVLVFDDLERANISTNNLLGCINDYCENLHINTIVVANEEKIKSNRDDKVKYDEIKEKIIQRTIRYSPDYSAMVFSVINGMVYRSDDVDSEIYKKFLITNKEIISSIFSGESIDEIQWNRLDSKKYSENSREKFENEKEKIQELLKHRPHNIRSLKCAIQDFERIYSLLVEKRINNREKWLFTYLSYVLSFRAGLIPEGSTRYGTIFSHENVGILYSGFYDEKYITDGIKKWIRYGEWSKDTLDAELDYVVNRDKAITPEEKVRMNNILELDEDDIKVGYPILLEKAYTGDLELNDYVNLLFNSRWVREYSIKLPVNIDLEKICEGIHKKIESMIQVGEEQPRYPNIIGEDSKEAFLPEELDAYKIIEEFLKTNTLIFEKNKAFYKSQIKTNPISTLSQSLNKHFDIFDVDMAEATADGFEAIPNAEKSSFINYFEQIWKANIYTKDYKIKLPEDGFLRLKQRISQFKNKCQGESLFISEAHANYFLEVINKLIDEQKSKLEVIQNKEKEARRIAETKSPGTVSRM